MKIKFFIITAVLSTVILCSAGFVGAQTPTIAQLQAQIASLQAQLQALQAQQQNTTQTWCHTFNTNLGYANSGSSEVGYLHTVLDKETISYSPDTGNIYSEGTMSAVVAFQQKYGIAPLSGYVGTLTRTKLNSLYGCGTTPNLTCTPNWKCGDWYPCVNGFQSRTCTDSNMCGVTTNRPDMTRSQNCSPSTSPTITFTSPAGGEQIQAGATVDVSYSVGGGLFDSDKIDVRLINDDNPDNNPNKPGWINMVSSNSNAVMYYNSYRPSGQLYSGGQTIQLSDVFPSGSKYKIQMRIYRNIEDQNHEFDYYSNYFSIVAPKCAQTADCASDLICAGGSCVAPPDTKFITLTSPNGGEQWAQGSTHNITWTSSGLEVNDEIMVYLVNNAFNQNPTMPFTRDIIADKLITKVPENAGSFSWTVPSGTTLGSIYQIEILIYDGGVKPTPNEYSNFFSIVAPGTPTKPIPTPITVTSPKGGETWTEGSAQTIKWNTVGISASNKMLVYLKNNAGEYYFNGASDISNTVPNNGSFSVTVPLSLSPGQYKAVVSGQNYFAASNYFTIVAPKVLPPTLPPGCASSSGYSTTTGLPCTTTAKPSVTITSGAKSASLTPTIFGTASGLTQLGIVLNNSSGNKIYGSGLIPVVNGNWSVIVSPALTTGVYMVDIYDANNNMLEHGGYLNIASSAAQPSITATSPNGGETLTQGQTATVSWISASLLASDKIDVWLYSYTNSSSTAFATDVISGSLAGNANSFNWTVPFSVANSNNTNIADSNKRYKIDIEVHRGLGSSLTYDLSDSYFSIVAPPTTLNCDGLKSSQSYYFNTCLSGGFDNVCFDKNSGVYQGCTKNSNNDCTVNSAHSLQNILCPVTAQPSATILAAAQVANPTPYIIGTASGVSQVVVMLSGQYGVIYNSGAVPVVNGNWSVTVNQTLALGQYVIYVRDINNNQLTSKSLTIISSTSAQPSITITSPVGDASWKQNTLSTWTWSTSGSISAVDIYLVNPNGTGNLPFAKSYPNKGAFQWAVGSALSGWRISGVLNGNYIIAVCPAGNEIGTSCGQFNVNIYGTIPNIGIISPNGGEAFQVGGTISVSFTNPQQGEQYQINLLKPAIASPTVYTLGTVAGTAGTQQTNTFTIPASISAGTYTAQVIQLSNQGSCVNACAEAESNSFTIISSQTSYPSSITIISPSGGEAWKTGETHNIIWSTQNIPSSSNVTIQLNAQGDEENKIAIGYSANSGSYSWTIPTAINGVTLAGNTYTIEITALDTAGNVLNNTSAPFSIAVPLNRPNVAITDITADQNYVYVTYVNNGTPATGNFTIMLNTSVKSFLGNPLYPYSIPLSGVSERTEGYALGLIGLKPGDNANITATIVWQGTAPAGVIKSAFSKTVKIPTGGASGLVVPQNNLASIADAIAKIYEELRLMLNK